MGCWGHLPTHLVTSDPAWVMHNRPRYGWRCRDPNNYDLGQLGFAAKVRKDKSKQSVSQMMVWLVVFFNPVELNHFHRDRGKNNKYWKKINNITLRETNT